MADNKRKGMLCAICSAFFLSIVSISIRLAGDLDSMEKVFIRNLFCTIFTLCLIIKNKPSFKTTGRGYTFLALRAIFGAVSVCIYFYVIDRMQLADATMLNRTAFIWSIVFSVFILKEKAKLPHIIAISFALIGSLFIIKPSPALFTPAALLAALSGVTAGFSYTATRAASKEGVSPVVLVFFFSLACCFISIPPAIANFSLPTLPQFIALVSCGTCTLIAQIFVAKSYSLAAAKDISIFDYSQGLFAAIWGFILFSEIPDIYSFLGYLIIISMAIYIFMYDKNIAAAEG